MNKRIMCSPVLGISILLAAAARPIQGQESSNEPLRLVRADRLIGSSPGEARQVKLVGNVVFQQGETDLICDEATHFEDRQWAELRGRVHIRDGEHVLDADTVTIDTRERLETARGHVVLETRGRRISSRFLSYSQTSKIAHARQDVLLEDLIRKARLTSGSLTYNRILDYAHAEGSPVLAAEDTSSGEEMIVSGRIMDGWGESQKVLVTDSVRIAKGDVRAEAGLLEYHAKDRLLLLQAVPVIYEKKQTMRADSIEFYLVEDEFDRGSLRGNATIVQKDSLTEDVLKGNLILMTTEPDSIRRVMVQGRAESVYHSEEEEGGKGKNQLSGDRLTLLFRGGEIQWIQVESNPGLCTGTFTPEGGDEKVAGQP
jgi:lipopolysaccharide export system protein LptA